MLSAGPTRHDEAAAGWPKECRAGGVFEHVQYVPHPASNKDGRLCSTRCVFHVSPLPMLVGERITIMQNSSKKTLLLIDRGCPHTEHADRSAEQTGYGQQLEGSGS